MDNDSFDLYDDYKNSDTNVPPKDKPEAYEGDSSVINKIFDPEPIIKIYEKSMAGGVRMNKQWKKVRPALAGDDFIAKSSMGLRAIINPINMQSKKDADEYYSILIENVLAFCRMCEDEPTVYGKDYPQIFLLYSNSLEMFAGHVINGHSSDMLKQILTNTYKEVAELEPERGFDPFAGLVGNTGGNNR